MDFSFVVSFGFCCGFGWDFFELFGFEFCCKIWVFLLWVWLGLVMGKIGANLRLETERIEERSEGEERERRDQVRKLTNRGGYRVRGVRD